MPPTTPERIPEPSGRKQRKLLRSYDIKLTDPVTTSGVEMFKVKMPDAFRLVGRSEAASAYAWYFVNVSNLAVAKVVREADGALSTVAFERPPKGFDAGTPPPASMSGGLSSKPEVGIFFENFACVMRGFIRQARPMERERFENLIAIFPLVREWAIDFDEKYPDRVEVRGSMLEDVEAHIRCARLILDVAPGCEEGSAVFDEPTVRSWILANASTERGPLAVSVYRGYIDQVAKLDPKLAASMRKAHESDRD